MFNIAIKSNDDKCVRMVQVCCVDTLFEAELYALAILRRRFSSESIVLVYRDDLVYGVYDDSELVGELCIRLIG
jgi:hypothetical protein